MTTTDDIARRVEETDSARSARRTKAAQLIGELARERAMVVHRLADIDQQIGDAIVESSDVISVDELATFTEVPIAELNQVLDARKPVRGRRRRSTARPTAGKGVREPAASSLAQRRAVAPAADSPGGEGATP